MYTQLLVKDLISDASIRLVQVVREQRLVDRGHEAACLITGQIDQRPGVRPQVEVLAAEMLPEVTSTARGGGLLVIGSRPGNPIRLDIGYPSGACNPTLPHADLGS
jgi:hypothetical protein